MAKLANIDLTWKKSPSPGIVKTEIFITVDGQENSVTLDPLAESFRVQIKADTNASFKIVNTDDEGLTVTSLTYDFRVGDLTAPLPATELSHTIVSIEDDSPPPPPVMQAARPRR
jgi:hypothetical protein